MGSPSRVGLTSYAYHAYDTLPNLLEAGFKFGNFADPPYRLTLIGDAAHLMTPFAGVGVNVAMEDALSLATQLKQWKKNVWDKAGPNASSSLLMEPVRAYEEEMFPRAEAYAKETMMYYDLFFNERGGIAMCEQFAKAKAEEKASKAPKVDLSAEITELSLTAAVEA